MTEARRTAEPPPSTDEPRRPAATSPVEPIVSSHGVPTFAPAAAPSTSPSTPPSTAPAHSPTVREESASAPAPALRDEEGAAPHPIPIDEPTTWDEVPFDLFDDVAPLESSSSDGRVDDDALPMATRTPATRRKATSATVERVQRYFPGRVIDVVPRADVSKASPAAEEDPDAQVD